MKKRIIVAIILTLFLPEAVTAATEKTPLQKYQEMAQHMASIDPEKYGLIALEAFKPKEPSENDKQIQALMARGWPQIGAEDIVYGFLIVVVNPVTGKADVINKATGKAIPVTYLEKNK